MNRIELSLNVIIECDSETETIAAATKLADACESGLIVTLDGPLGAGKTRFVRAFAVAVGVNENDVSSPTYVIMQHYQGREQLHHLDLYRLADADEFDELGLDELFESQGICLIEWANRFPEMLPADRLSIEIQVTGATSRYLIVSSHGPNSDQALQRWQKLRKIPSPSEETE